MHKLGTPAIALGLLAGHCFAQISTDPAGGSVPFENRQPSVTVQFFVQDNGVFGAGVPLRIFAYPNSTAASLSGWLLADGRSLSTSSNQLLYTQIGTMYGGNGVNLFNLPDLRGRTIIGEGTLSGVQYIRGQTVGTNTCTMAASNMPAHSHTEFDSRSGSVNAAGSSAGIGNLQPALVMYASVSTSGIFPTRNGFGGSPIGADTLFYGQIVYLCGAPTTAFSNVRPRADGAQYGVQLNQALFSILGVAFGGNGFQFFNLPDLRGRVGVGTGEAPGLSPYSLGGVSGSSVINISPASLPQHRHTVAFHAPTGFAGTVAGVSTVQPSLALTYGIALDGAYPNSSGMLEELGYIGEIICFGGNFVPDGYIPCDGREVSISQYSVAYSLMGTTYGGNGFTTFRVPDLRGRVLVGASPAAGLEAGTYFGTETVALSPQNLATHTHTFNAYCPGDLGIQGGLTGHDDVRDNNDFVVFIDLFFNHKSSADVGSQGGVNGPDNQWDNNDFVVFIDRFFAPC